MTKLTANVPVPKDCDCSNSTGSMLLEGESIEELAREYARLETQGPSVAVRDEPGFIRGWIRADGNWRAA